MLLFASNQLFAQAPGVLNRGLWVELEIAPAVDWSNSCHRISLMMASLGRMAEPRPSLQEQRCDPVHFFFRVHVKTK